MSLYWEIRGPLEQARKTLMEMPRERLVNMLINERYNRFCSDVADAGLDEKDAPEHGKRLPYIGWYWRHVDFAGKNIPIGHCGEFVGFMENNKWNYPERMLTQDEADRLIELIEAAMRESEKGGSLADIIRARNERLKAVWDYMQELKP